MTSYKPLLCAVAALVCAGPLFVHAQDAPAFDTKGMLEALDKLKTQATDSAKSSRSQLIAKLNQASASPSASWALYQEAVKETRFSGEAKENTQFREWKKKDEEKLDDPNFRSAIAAHLQYLSLTLQRSNGAKTKDMLPSIMNYLSAVQAGKNTFAPNRELMHTDLTSSMFVRWLQIDGWVAEAKDWELMPGNVEGIMEKTVLPYWREEKSSKAVEYWDGRLARESNEVQEQKLDFPKERFETMRKPVLLWSRAAEFDKIGMRNKAALEMFNVIKAYPAHPDFSKWVGELEKMLKPDPTEATAAAVQ